MASKKELNAIRRANSLNRIVGKPRFKVVETPIPGGSGRTLLASWTIVDTQTGEEYVYESIYGTAALAMLERKLKSERNSKTAQHADFEADDDTDDFVDEFLEHYGVLGMKWGVRKDPKRAYTRATKKLSSLDKSASKAERKANVREQVSLRKQQRADTAVLFPRMKALGAEKAIARSEKTRQNYTQRVIKAKSWADNMAESFKGIDVSNFGSESDRALGKKYVDMKLPELMANAQTSVANKQLRIYYNRMSKR